MNIVIIAGSNHKSSTSTRLAEYLERLMRQQGHMVFLYNLFQSPLPFFSPEETFSDHVGLYELKQLLINSDAIVLASPEYHGGMSGTLKNALDHLGQEHFDSKLVLSVSSSGGAVGVSSLQQLQSIVRNLHGINSPEWISIGGEQRKWFQSTHDIYNGGQDINDRIHRVIGEFIKLTSLVRGHLHSSTFAL